MKLKSLAFTLAEVLITMTIIGVVAGITVPILSNTTQNEQFKTGALKNLSVLNNALTRCYAFTGERMDDFGDSAALKERFFDVHFNEMPEPNFASMSNDWGPFEVEQTFYLIDGARYGISPKITDDCMFDPDNPETSIPCYMIYVDVNGDRNPNKITMDLNFYKDINVYYAYFDRFIFQPGDEASGNISVAGNGHGDDGGSSSGGGDDTGGDDTGGSGSGGDDSIDDGDDGGDDGGGGGGNGKDKNKKKKCADVHPPETCAAFCERNHFNSSLCRD